MKCDYLISLHKDGDNIPDHLNISKDYPTSENLQILITLQNIINDVDVCTTYLLSLVLIPFILFVYAIPDYSILLSTITLVLTIHAL